MISNSDIEKFSTVRTLWTLYPVLWSSSVRVSDIKPAVRSTQKILLPSWWNPDVVLGIVSVPVKKAGMSFGLCKSTTI